MRMKIKMKMRMVSKNDRSHNKSCVYRKERKSEIELKKRKRNQTQLITFPAENHTTNLIAQYLEANCCKVRDQAIRALLLKYYLIPYCISSTTHQI